MFNQASLKRVIYTWKFSWKYRGGSGNCRKVGTHVLLIVDSYVKHTRHVYTHRKPSLYLETAATGDAATNRGI